jgi:hypothetical protein
MGDNAVVHSNEIKWAHVIESIKEPRYYAFMLAAMLINFQNSAINNFSSLITAGFGFTVNIFVAHFLCFLIEKILTNSILFNIEFKRYFVNYSFWRH